MCEFWDVFLDELPRLAPKREVEFNIELALEIAPICKIPYKMVSANYKRS